MGVDAHAVPFMMIDNDTLKQLLRINDALLQLCKWLNEQRGQSTSNTVDKSNLTDTRTSKPRSASNR